MLISYTPAFVSSCKAAGVTVSSLTVGGSSNSAPHVLANGGILAATLAGAAAYLL